MADVCEVTVWVTAVPKWWTQLLMGPLRLGLRVATRLGCPRRLLDRIVEEYVRHGWVLHFGRPQPKGL